MLTQNIFSGLIQVHITCPSLDEARRICKTLLEKKLVACAQIEREIESHYVWKGVQECSAESRVTLKSSASLFDELCCQIKALSSYQTPEIVATPLLGSLDYLEWVNNSLLCSSK